MKTTALLFFVSICNICFGQEQSARANFTTFKSYISSILVDTSDYWSEYPTPPAVTDSVLTGMEKEIKNDDSAAYYLEKLSFVEYKSHADEQEAFEYFYKKDFIYCIIALAAHWEPDVRLEALIYLNKKLSIRPLVNSANLKNGKWAKFDKTAIEFLVYLLESNPIFISGSENATIHGNYISNIMWDLDLLTGENIVDKKRVGEWYKNDLQHETAILKWKSYAK